MNSKRVYHALLYNADVLLNVCHQRDLKLDIANLEIFCATQHNITLPHTCFCVDLSTHMSIHNWIEWRIPFACKILHGYHAKFGFKRFNRFLVSTHYNFYMQAQKNAPFLISDKVYKTLHNSTKYSTNNCLFYKSHHLHVIGDVLLKCWVSLYKTIFTKIVQSLL